MPSFGVQDGEAVFIPTHDDRLVGGVPRAFRSTGRLVGRLVGRFCEFQS